MTNTKNGVKSTNKGVDAIVTQERKIGRYQSKLMAFRWVKFLLILAIVPAVGIGLKWLGDSNKAKVKAMMQGNSGVVVRVGTPSVPGAAYTRVPGTSNDGSGGMGVLPRDYTLVALGAVPTRGVSDDELAQGIGQLQEINRARAYQQAQDRVSALGEAAGDPGQGADIIAELTSLPAPTATHPTGVILPAGFEGVPINLSGNAGQQAAPTYPPLRGITLPDATAVGIQKPGNGGNSDIAPLPGKAFIGTIGPRPSPLVTPRP